jgi:predicted DNA-binding protein YlxM (UPF0122 family)
MTTTKVKKAPENLTKAQRYEIIDAYIYSPMTNSQIAEKFGTSKGNVELIISRHFKALANVKETKSLVQTQFFSGGGFIPKEQVLDTEKINREFLELLSDPDSTALSDNELMFCELYNDNGDEVRALEESKLNLGLRRSKEDRDREEYEQSLRLRSFYLRRKPNVGSYLNKLKSEKIQKIINGKEFVQNELLEVIERLKNSGGDKNLSTYLKAVVELGRSYGAFEDKLSVSELSGDSALDKILMKAREAKESKEEPIN